MPAAKLNNETLKAAAAAYERLLELAETRNSGQVARVASFLAATWNSRSFHFDLRDLCAVDEEIRQDMLAVLSALYGMAPYSYDLVENGEARVGQVIRDWRIKAIKRETDED